MTDTVAALDNVDLDSGADELIAQCLDMDAPRSFFLFAGAGSGKTGSLVRALKSVQTRFGRELRFSDRRVAVITYTNKARDEIERRLEFDPIIQVSTIHSFAWQLIGGLDRDIREWLRGNLTLDIADLRAAEAKGRAGKASDTRKVKIASKTTRLERLNEVRSFTYSPTGENRGRAALSHAEVLKIAADFLAKPAMRQILIGEHPILLIDESQDTNGPLLDALFAVQAAHRDVFVLGLFGDMMQRIYSDGRKGLGEDLPEDWAKPRKQLNHRCPKRIIALLNKIRGPVDAQVQTPRTTAVASPAVTPLAQLLAGVQGRTVRLGFAAPQPQGELFPPRCNYAENHEPIAERPQQQRLEGHGRRGLSKPQRPSRHGPARYPQGARHALERGRRGHGLAASHLSTL